jgi:hypothetical protein
MILRGYGSGDWIRTSDLVVTLYSTFSCWRGLSHHPHFEDAGRYLKDYCLGLTF